MTRSSKRARKPAPRRSRPRREETIEEAAARCSGVTVEQLRAAAPLEPVRPSNPVVFVLKARDVTVPDTMRFWARAAAEVGAPAEKIGRALLEAVDVERWQKTNGVKVPD